MLAAFLQNELTVLSTEAKRKNPEIKEAAERLLFLLKSIKEKSTVPDAVSIELSKTEDTLTPFLLSFATKNQKLISISVGCFQKLISFNAIPPSSIGTILKSLSEQHGAAQDLQLKILQTILPLVTNYTHVHDELLADALLLCYKLQDSKISVVTNTASATFRQLVIHTFEKLAKRIKENPNILNQPASASAQDLSEGTVTTVNIRLDERDAFMIFKDLCSLANGDPGVFLKLQNMQKSMGLELIEAVITDTPSLFAIYPDMLALVKDSVCPMLIRSFSEKLDFPLTVRLMRVVRIIVKQFHTTLAMECEIFLSMFAKIIETDTYTQWQKILVLECYKCFFIENNLQRFMFEAFDRNHHSANIYSEMISGICSVALGSQNYLLFHLHNDKTDYNAPESFALSSTTAAIKIPCIDHLEKLEAPPFPDAYPILLSIQCLSLTVDKQHEFIIPILNKPTNTAAEVNPNLSVITDGCKSDVQESNSESSIFLAIEMAKACGPTLLNTLTLFLASSLDLGLFDRVLKTIEKYTIVVGSLGLVPYRDSFIGVLCKICISSQIPNNIDFHNPTKPIEAFNFERLHNRSQTPTLSDRNLKLLHSIVNIAINLVDVVDTKIWYAILETIQFADTLIALSKVQRRVESASSGAELTTSLKDNLGHSRFRSLTANAGHAQNTSGILTQMTYLESYSVRGSITPIEKEQQHNLYLAASKHIFDKTYSMKPRQFLEFLQALLKVANETMMGNTAHLSQTVRETLKSLDEKNFAATKVHELFLLNLKKFFLNVDDFSHFDLVISQLVQIIHNPACLSTIRLQICNSIGELIVLMSQEPEFGNPLIELHTFEALSTIMGFDIVTSDTQHEHTTHDIQKFPGIIDVRKSCLETIYKLLQTSGQNIKEGWLLLLEIILTVIRGSQKRLKPLDTVLSSSKPDLNFLLSPSQASESPSHEVSFGPSVKTAVLFRIGFPCVQLICTDFMAMLNPIGLSRLIETVSSFGSYCEDLNMSLTSIGLLWSICDYILTKRQAFEKEGKFDDHNAELPDEDSTALPETSTAAMGSSESLMEYSLEHATMCTKAMDVLWMTLLRQLSELCSDERPEVRNSANQTLFRTINMNGRRLTLESWRLCISHVLFPLMDGIQANPDEGPKYQSDKPWDDTKILILNGVSKSLMDFLHVLILLGDQFDADWVKFLNYMKRSCLESSQEVAIAALKNLRLLAQYPKSKPEEDISESLRSKFVHLFKLEFDTWLEIGNSILADVDDVKEVSQEEVMYSIQWSDGVKPTLLFGRFNQDTLAVYFALIFDLNPIIHSVFGESELQSVTKVLKSLLLYHSKISPGATQTRIRVDLVNDLDTTTPTQNSFLDLLNNKLDFKPIPNSRDIIVKHLSDTIIFPFILPANIPPSDSDAGTPQQLSSTLSLNTRPKKHTYMALSKKSINILSAQYEPELLCVDLFSNGSFEAALNGLGVPMKFKYDCPNPGSKDPTPLWRLAVSTSMKLISSFIAFCTTSSDQLPKDRLESIYKVIIQVLSDFLLSNSQQKLDDQTDTSIDENFDISVINFVEELLTYFGGSSVPETFCQELITIIVRVATNDMMTITDINLFKQSSINFKTSGFKITSPTLKPNSVVEVDEILNISNDSSSSIRENVSIACIETLFKLCSDKRPENESNLRVAKLTMPILNNMCKSIITKYATDRPLSGRFPMPRCRNQELITILQGLHDLSVWPNSTPVITTETKGLCKYILMIEVVTIEHVKNYLQSSSTSHLFLLYPQFCQLLGVVAGSVWFNNAGSDGSIQFADEARMTDLVQGCLKRIGQTFE
ncbi:hypothetical protein BC833DRAFT_656820 [Globomyces pollinis-pini]|nr:hypothetical protein BC833DRAFT_656820 [Globomyces pollinis-pini]